MVGIQNNSPAKTKFSRLDSRFETLEQLIGRLQMVRPHLRAATPPRGFQWQREVSPPHIQSGPQDAVTMKEKVTEPGSTPAGCVNELAHWRFEVSPPGGLRNVAKTAEPPQEVKEPTDASEDVGTTLSSRGTALESRHSDSDPANATLPETEFLPSDEIDTEPMLLEDKEYQRSSPQSSPGLACDVASSETLHSPACQTYSPAHESGLRAGTPTSSHLRIANKEPEVTHAYTAADTSATGSVDVHDITATKLLFHKQPNRVFIDRHTLTSSSSPEEAPSRNSTDMTSAAVNLLDVTGAGFSEILSVEHSNNDFKQSARGSRSGHNPPPNKRRKLTHSSVQDVNTVDRAEAPRRSSRLSPEKEKVPVTGLNKNSQQQQPVPGSVVEPVSDDEGDEVRVEVPGIRLCGLPQEIQDAVANEVSDLTRRNGEWRNFTTQHCIRQFLSSQSSIFSWSDGDKASCRTCTHTRRPCIRVVGGRPSVLPLPSVLRRTSASPELSFWQWPKGKRPPKDTWTGT